MTNAKKRTNIEKIQYFQARIVSYVLAKHWFENDDQLYEASKRLKGSIIEVLAINHEQLEKTLGVPKKLIDLMDAGKLPNLGDALCYLWDEDGCWKNETSTMRLVDRFNKFTLMLRLQNGRITAHHVQSKSGLLPAIDILRHAMFYRLAGQVLDENRDLILEEPLVIVAEWQTDVSLKLGGWKAKSIHQFGRSIECIR